MAHGSTDIRVIQEDSARPDYDAVVSQLEALPGVVVAVVAWQNEDLDEWEQDLLAQARAGNPHARTKLWLLR